MGETDKQPTLENPMFCRLASALSSVVSNIVQIAGENEYNSSLECATLLQQPLGKG